MCAAHPNVVQILEVYANSVQFPHESSPRYECVYVSPEYTQQWQPIALISLIQKQIQHIIKDDQLSMNLPFIFSISCLVYKMFVNGEAAARNIF